MKVRVESVQRHLHRVKRKARGEHLQVNGWVLVAGKSDIPYLSFFLGLCQSFRGAVLPNEQLRIVIEADAVDLPKVQVVGSVPMQRLFEHAKRKSLVAPMGADLGHQEHAISQAR